MCGVRRFVRLELQTRAERARPNRSSLTRSSLCGEPTVLISKDCSCGIEASDPRASCRRACQKLSLRSTSKTTLQMWGNMEGADRQLMWSRYKGRTATLTSGEYLFASTREREAPGTVRDVREVSGTAARNSLPHVRTEQMVGASHVM
jgi:hypothetical protein